MKNLLVKETKIETFKKHAKRWKLYIALVLIFSILAYIIVQGTIVFVRQLLNVTAYAPTVKVYAQEKVATPSAQIESSIKDRVMMAAIKEFGTDEALDIEHLVNGESGFNPYAINSSSGACGLFQALPCSKMKCELSDVDCQIKWGLGYIKARYGSPAKAWSFWQEQEPHWY